MVSSPLDGSSDEDPHNFNNPIHGILVREYPIILAVGIEALVEVVPLVLVGKSL